MAIEMMVSNWSHLHCRLHSTIAVTKCLQGNVSYPRRLMHFPYRQSRPHPFQLSEQRSLPPHHQIITHQAYDEAITGLGWLTFPNPSSTVGELPSQIACRGAQCP